MYQHENSTKLISNHNRYLHHHQRERVGKSSGVDCINRSSSGSGNGKRIGNSNGGTYDVVATTMTMPVRATTATNLSIAKTRRLRRLKKQFAFRLLAPVTLVLFCCCFLLLVSLHTIEINVREGGADHFMRSIQTRDTIQSKRQPPVGSDNDQSRKKTIYQQKEQMESDSKSAQEILQQNHRHEATSQTKSKMRVPASDVDSNSSNDNNRRKKEKMTEQSRNNGLLQAVPHFDTPIYWNLNCPLELSMFSGIHMGAGGSRRAYYHHDKINDDNGNDYLHRSWAAREAALNATSFFQDQMNWDDMSTSSSKRRIYFIGDSIMRQVFISVGCLLWNDMVVDYAIPWFDKDRAVKTNHPNTIGAGKPHSKFEEGRIRLKNDIELIYHHGIGRLLDLQGDDYQTHESPDEGWLKSCYTRQSLTALVPTFPDWTSTQFKRARGNDDYDPRSRLTTSTVKRERLDLSSDDVVILNAGVHSTRSSNFQNIADFFRCQKMMTTPTTPSLYVSRSPPTWPHFLYLVTGPAHFPTATGAYDRNLGRDLARETANTTNTTKAVKFQCKGTQNYTAPQTEDVDFCAEHGIPIVGMDVLPKQRTSGDLHVGSGDCLHWLQPGLPDLVAIDIFKYLTVHFHGTLLTS